MNFKNYYENLENEAKNKLRLEITEKCNFKSKQTFYTKKDNNSWTSLEKEYISYLTLKPLCDLFPSKPLLEGVVINAFSCYLRSVLTNSQFDNLNKHLKLTEDALKIIIENPKLMTKEQFITIMDLMISNDNLVSCIDMYEQFGCCNNTIPESEIDILNDLLNKIS